MSLFLEHFHPTRLATSLKLTVTHGCFPDAKSHCCSLLASQKCLLHLTALKGKIKIVKLYRSLWLISICDILSLIHCIIARVVLVKWWWRYSSSHLSLAQHTMCWIISQPFKVCCPLHLSKPTNEIMAQLIEQRKGFDRRRQKKSLANSFWSLFAPCCCIRNSLKGSRELTWLYDTALAASWKSTFCLTF